MSTIVTYNRGAQGLPVAGSSTDARLRVWEDFDGPTSKFTLVTGMATAAGAGGVIANTVNGTVSSATSPKFSGDLTTTGDSMSFLARAKFAGRATGSSINKLAFGFSTSAALVSANSVMFGAEVHSHAAAVNDAFEARVDTGGADSDVLTGKVQSVKGLEDFDSTAYFTVGGILLNEGDNYRAQFFINGVLIKETRVSTTTSGFTGGICALFGHQPAVQATVGLATIDYIAGDTPR